MLRAHRIAHDQQHETLDAFRLVKAFRTSQTTTGGDAYFAEFTSPLSVMKTTVYVAETIVSDLFIVRVSNGSLCKLRLG
ncbi:hypothetical protein OF83DRAFT_1114617 [Amylostereum chailletii]|nr:hypothetical protein OF83DRAFT_1114617 [Amylostereum chailletii]